jgi:mannose-6-phosphate isomerase-like protein (cupin superfamily)
VTSEETPSTGAHPVFDFKTDLGNVVVTSEIRCRFMKEMPHTAREWHCHDGAAEVFLVLEGEVEFRIEGRTCVAGPGQLVHVPPYHRHTLRALGPDPAYIYLSVSPHVEPSHTFFDDSNRAVPGYGAWRD